jgi:hypothetical protein
MNNVSIIKELLKENKERVARLKDILDELHNISERLKTVEAKMAKLAGPL